LNILAEKFRHNLEKMWKHKDTETARKQLELAYKNAQKSSDFVKKKIQQLNNFHAVNFSLRYPDGQETLQIRPEEFLPMLENLPMLEKWRDPEN
jgi:tRNA A37 N6-isopentenylltransferase MiaA